MKPANTHTNPLPRILAVVLLLFMLAPCVVKQSILQPLGITYVKTVNKTKTAHQCQTQQLLEQTNTQVVHLQKQKRSTFHTQKTITSPTEVYINKLWYGKLLSGNSPPRYILYQQLKLAMA